MKKRWKWKALVCLASLAGSLLSVEGQESTSAPAAKVNTPILSDLDILVLSNNALGFDLFSKIKRSDQNLVFSPYSGATALQMLYAGAAGLTQSQMSRVLHFTLSPKALEGAAENLTSGLANKTKLSADDFQLSMANGLWVQKGYSILPAFQNAVAKSFKGVLKGVDFKERPDFTRTDINSWVKLQTQGKIVDLLSSGDISSSTRLVLVSAMYMRAKWRVQFDSSLTRPTPFFPSPSHTLTVPMMTSTASYGFQEEKDFSIVELPYSIREASPQVSMYIVLPRETYGLEDVVNGLSPQRLLDLMRGLKSTHLTLTVPKFKVTSTVPLKQILEELGLTDPFSSTANFSGIDGTQDLQVTNALQKAFIAVDEKGTEAGVATAISIGLKSIAQPPAVLVVDHPFLFFVVDKITGTFLFMGQIISPQV